MSNIQNLTVDQLRKAVAIKEQIERLQRHLDAVALNRGPRAAEEISVPFGRRKRRMSRAARAKIAAAAKARWAKIKGAKHSKKPAKRRGWSAAAKARLSAAARARWKKAKAAGKNAL